MLSRIAERVYWIGRQTERAECVSRMVNAYHYSATQLGALEERSELHDLMAALGEHEDGDATFRATAQWWVNAEANPSSVVSCIRGARDNARRAREVLSLELWEALNSAAATINSLQKAHAGYATVADRVVLHTQAFAGVVETTAPRDETWEILRLGTMVERAAMTLRAMLIGAQAAERLPGDDPLALHAWTLTLRSCSALDAYRRTSVAIPHGPAVVAMLLHSATCPRSVAFALREAQAMVPFGSGASATLDWARQSLLAKIDPTSKDIPALCTTLLEGCDRIHDALLGEWRGRWESA